MRAREQGMSLVEVLVGVAIGLIGILIITQAYIASDNFNRSALGAGSGQTNGLIALFTIQRDVEMAGYGINQANVLGCGNLDWYYNGNYSPNVQAGSPLPNLVLAPVYIDSSVTPNTITVMYASGTVLSMGSTIQSFNASSSEVMVSGTQGYNVGDLILLVSQSPSTPCTMANITNVQATASKLQMNPGASGLYNPPSWGSFPSTYTTNDLIFDIGNPVVRTYSIANPAVGQYRLQLTDTLLNVAGTASPQDLVDGVVDLRAQYGKDDGAGGATAGDGIVDEYNNVQPATSAQWQQVLSVRIGVLVRIGTYEKPATPGGACTATTTAPTWQGGTFTVPGGLPSCYRYRVYQTVVPLRNMLWGYS
ncbi:MAG TPA: PilW family protein [Burkholderiales bacterium]|nr:PilW family protein [Burkholderiales bacterium]